MKETEVVFDSMLMTFLYFKALCNFVRFPLALYFKLVRNGMDDKKLLN